jgi:hypothetical protein
LADYLTDRPLRHPADLEDAGVVFIDENGGGPGVRLIFIDQNEEGGPRVLASRPNLAMHNGRRHRPGAD